MKNENDSKEEMSELKIVLETLVDKLALDLVAINIKNVNPLCDYFVICSSKNERHSASLASSLRECAMLHNLDFKKIEGKVGSEWILADLGNIVVHIFTDEGRSNYDLEGLWGDVEMVDIDKIIAK
ncbi:MAG: ribosome silencing factor [Bacilli bacterium]